jgi:hypothetical protein
MLKGIAGLAAVLVVAGSAHAQESPRLDVPRQETPRQEVPRQDNSPRLDIPRQDGSHHDAFLHDAAHRQLSQADLNTLTDARIAMAKAMLQMSPEQTKFWPPVEEAIRNGAEARYRRIAQMRAMMEHSEREPDLVAMMRGRADALSERATNLRKLADAWQPLYQSLNADQKDRLRLVTSHVLHEVRGALARRHAENMPDIEESEED